MSNCHNSSPLLPSLAVKNSVEPTTVKLPGRLLEIPVLMSDTICGLLAPTTLVVSNCHNSLPLLPSLAVKNSVEPTTVKLPGELLPDVLMSYTICGLLAPTTLVVSNCHNSSPLLPSLAVKNSVEPTTVKLPGEKAIIFSGLLPSTTTLVVSNRHNPSLLLGEVPLTPIYAVEPILENLKPLLPLPTLKSLTMPGLLTLGSMPVSYIINS